MPWCYEYGPPQCGARATKFGWEPLEIQPCRPDAWLRIGRLINGPPRPHRIRPNYSSLPSATLSCSPLFHDRIGLRGFLFNMARLGRRTKLVMAILLVGIAHSTFARNEKPKKLTQASVGRFKITLDDDQLPLEEMEKNRTSLRPHLAWLWLSAWDYWGNFTDETTPTEEEQVQSLTAFAKSELSPEEFNDFGGKILNHSKENASVTPLFDGQPHHDVVFSFMETVWNMSIATDYFINGAFIGVGARSDCAEAVDEVLSNASEWNKMGSSAATTMMALLPTFLAFGNL